MKKLATLNNKFTESGGKKENKFSRSRNFDFTCWLEKPLWPISTKFCDITDMFNKCRGKSPKVVCKMVFLTVSQNSQETIYVGVSY